MLDDAFVKFIIAIILFGIVLAFSSSYEDKAKEKIKKHLEEKGCQDIQISRVWTFGMRELTYNISFVDQQGKMNANTCIIASGWFSPGEIYWKKPLNL